MDPNANRWRVWLRRSALVARWAWRIILALVTMAALLLIGVSVWVYRKAGQEIRTIPALADPSRAPLPQPISFYSADGVLLGRYSPQQRIVLGANQIPKLMRDATVAIEDQRFYEHRGVDLQALVRAAWVDLRAHSAQQGGSTITMQYARNVYLNFHKTAHRKLQEVALALQLEAQWTKQRILTAYLNTVYYGDGAYGVEAAARDYFGVPARRLTIAQAAMLAGLVQDPVADDPRAHPDAARVRQAQVLDEMFGQGYITRQQLLEAKAHPVRIQPQPKARRPAEPQLEALLRSELDRTLSPVQRARGGLAVTATFRMADIRRARAALKAVYPTLGAKRPTVAASFVDPRTGRIVVVASNARRGYFDYATQARRQPGSVVKAFTTAKYIEEGGQLADPVDNSPLHVHDQRHDYTVTPSHPATTVGEALRFSQNPAFWRLYQKAGPARVLDLERKLGLTNMDDNPAAALGGVRYGTNTLQVAGAFAAIANSGRYIRPHAILRVRDLLGNTIYTDQPQARQVIPAEYDRQVLVGLRGVVEHGFPLLRAHLPLADTRQIAGKTGTTEDNADAWFAGATPQLAGVVWTGYGKRRIPLTNLPGGAVWGSTVPASTWNRLASDLLRGQPVLHFPAPKGLVVLPAMVGHQINQAQAALSARRLVAVQYVGKVAPLATPGIVLSVSRPAGTWVKPDTPLRVVYAVAQRTMPDLVNGTYLDAVRALGDFAPITAKLSPSNQPTGTVLSQSPPAGSLLMAHAPVTLDVATRRAPPITKVKKVLYVPSNSELGQLRSQIAQMKAQLARKQARPVVPDVTGLEPGSAQRVLESLGWRVIERGTGIGIADQRPQPGTPLSTGATVTLTLR